MLGLGWVALLLLAAPCADGMEDDEVLHLELPSGLHEIWIAPSERVEKGVEQLDLVRLDAPLSPRPPPLR